MSSTPRQRRSEGGPKGVDADVRGTLLAVGKALISERGLQPVALREVAERASVNQAMVRYYFGDKKGFLSQLLDDGIDDLVAVLVEEHKSFRTMLERFIGKLNEMSWLPVLLSQTVYHSDELRQDFLARHAPRLVGGLASALAKERPAAASIDVLMLISMLIYPQLARPLVELVFETTFDAAFADQLAGVIAGLMVTRPAPDTMIGEGLAERLVERITELELPPAKPKKA